jgi:hypothetical protein
MNFEPTDRLPIMRNGLGSHRYIQKLIGISETEYWTDQPAAHYRAMRALGQDFDLQKWFPPRQEEDRSWSRSETPKMWELEQVVSDLERRTAETDAKWQGLLRNPAEREARIQAICDYQVKE